MTDPNIQLLGASSIFAPSTCIYNDGQYTLHPLRELITGSLGLTDDKRQT